jgi:Photosynthesis system II assembly factor YCF48/Putative zinc-finger
VRFFRVIWLSSFETVNDMEALPKIVRKRLQTATRPGVHPQGDLLTAFAEKTLTGRERTRVIEHLSRCEDCREVVFLSAPWQEPGQIVGKIPSSDGWLSWPSLRWGTAIACVVVVGTAVTLRLQDRNSSPFYRKAASQRAQEVAPDSVLEHADKPHGTHGASADLRYDSAPASKGKEADEKKLIGENEAPARPIPRAMTATPRMRMQFDHSRQIHEDATGEDAIGTAGTIGGLGKGMTVAPATATLSKGANVTVKSANGQNQVAASHGAPGPGSTSETVEVQAGSAVVQVESADGDLAKSKDAPEAGTPVEGLNVKELKNPARAGTLTRNLADYSKTKMEGAPTTLAPRWMLTSGGTLQRSWDAGSTWETVAVADRVSFQTFAAVASEVWAGGAKGVLYHSSDAGRHWAQVIPLSNGDSLTAGIIHIDFVDGQKGEVTTVNGEIWTTSDSGKTWQKN